MGYRSGFVTFVGRPNAGKSTLLNAIVGEHISIISDKPQTTRSRINGVLTRDDAQIVFVDTPGIHKPRSPLGKRLNTAAQGAIADVDVTCFVLDATAPYGIGDAYIADTLSKDSVVVVTKSDLAKPESVLKQLATCAHLDFDAYFVVSGKTKDGIDDLLNHLSAKLPEGPALYPDDMITDQPDAFWVAELVREQLLAATRDELPHSIATRVTDWDPPLIRCEILVERDSQKAIVIGHNGSVLKSVGQAARKHLPEGTYLELVVKVTKNWQNDPTLLDRLNY